MLRLSPRLYLYQVGKGRLQCRVSTAVLALKIWTGLVKPLRSFSNLTVETGIASRVDLESVNNRLTSFL
jgi:hypothetical protein